MNVQPDPSAISDQLCQYARTNLVAPGFAFDETSTLADAGIDSFALVELLLYCERAFGVTVPESHLTHENLASLASLADCIAKLKIVKSEE